MNNEEIVIVKANLKKAVENIYALDGQIKILVGKVERLISETMKTSDQGAIDAANEVYYYLNEKFGKYLE